MKDKKNTQNAVQIINGQKKNLASRRTNANKAKTKTQNKMQNKVQNKTQKKSLKVRFLGGVGEIGKNMTALEFGKDIIIIDAGLSFPNDNMPGVDLVIPDVTFLEENKSRIRGIVITHGHEDHIGALPYILKEVNAPIFGTKLTLTLIASNLQA